MNNYNVLKIIIINIFLLTATFAQSAEPEVKIHYLGHSSFILFFDNGTTIVTDYGHHNAWINWGWDSPIHDMGDLIPNVMTYSHTNHEDHYDPDRIPGGVGHILTGMDSLIINGIVIKPIRTCESVLNVESNSSYLFTYKGLKLLHLGDVQVQIENIEKEDVKNHIKNIFPDTYDLLFMTIEGSNKFIPQAELFVDLLQPKRIIPMHYWSQEYREEFLVWLEDQNNNNKNYQVNRIENPNCELSKLENVTPVKILSFKRAPYEQPTNIKINKRIQKDFKLFNNYPNPFNPITTFAYKLPKYSYVKFSIYDINGCLNEILVNEYKNPGYYSIKWNAAKVSSGIYFYKIDIGEFSYMKKCLLVK